MMRAWILALVTLLVFAGRVAANTPCSQSSFHFDCGCWPAPSTEPTGTVDPIYCTVVPWQVGQPCSRACYDLPHGRVEAHAAAPGSSTRCDNAIGVRDTLRLGGGEDPAVSFEAVLVVHCTIANGGSAIAWLMGQHRQYSTSTSEEFVLPVSVVPGNGFEISYAVGASNASPCCVSGSGVADITADLRFRGLPPFYYLMSCAGNIAPVPASVTSWGGVKAMYR